MVDSSKGDVLQGSNLCAGPDRLPTKPSMNARSNLKGLRSPWSAVVSTGLFWLLLLPAAAYPDPHATLAVPASGQPATMFGEKEPSESSQPLLAEPAEGLDPGAETVAPQDEVHPVSRAASSYPLVVNDMVASFIDLFRSDQKRDIIERWLSRSGKYLGMIKEVFREKGLPEELAYTAMIESGFNPLAVSRAGAKGLWQFMEETGRRYGLTVNRWVDERLDPAKSTIAAAHYLKDLFGIFGSWSLAQAAYNAGELKVARALAATKSPDFWGLTRSRYLKDETKQFVPQILAATVIAQDPIRFGFDVVYQEPEEFDVVTVSRPTELRHVAKLAGTTMEHLRELNPALKVAVTPLTPSHYYPLRVPHGTADAVSAGLAEPSHDTPARWVVHHVAKGQRVEEVARLYGTTAARITEVNLLPRAALRAGTELLVPVMPRRPRGKGVGDHVHVVRQGETLGTIARLYGVTVDDMVRWNRLSNPDRLRVGESLRLRPREEPRPLVAASPSRVVPD